jgi:hypothetical protein
LRQIWTAGIQDLYATTELLNTFMVMLYVVVDDHVVPPYCRRDRQPLLSNSELIHYGGHPGVAGYHSQRR